ncbi:septum formation initiator family protein [Micromonospora echinofusca]|uniref:Cell division protein FtsB n=1 Tax=Micromonospora echinofusca TaxID=47858 RepID=A0A1C5G643_MICEH|nr:septum formation initiator family protein [Micromonospora echinofusca]SCG15168.1 Cell division protein FtsB [Micromonospora echinofusca]
MTIDKRDRRDVTGGGQRAPRSGGRTAAERATRIGTGTPRADRANRQEETRARGAREFPTQGSAALRPAERQNAGAARPPRLRVAPPPPVRVPRAPFAALVLVLVVGGVLGILLVNTKINENAFRLEKLQEQQAKLDVEQQQLNKEIADAEAPGNLEARARKLGLVEAGEPAYIRLPDGKVIGVPQPAEGQPSITSQQGAGG